MTPDAPGIIRKAEDEYCQLALQLRGVGPLGVVDLSTMQDVANYMEFLEDRILNLRARVEERKSSIARIKRCAENLGYEIGDISDV